MSVTVVSVVNCRRLFDRLLIDYIVGFSAGGI